MKGHPDTPPSALVPGPGSVPARLAASFRAALEAADLSGARAVIGAALDRGLPGGRLYVEVVRPALAGPERGPERSLGARLAAGIGEAVLADLVRRLPERSAARRAAVLSCRAGGIEAVDGNLATAYLEVGGWSVARRGGDGLVAGPGRRHGAVELAVAVIAGAEDALRLAPACTELRRLADPPVIVLCDFSGRSASLVSLAAPAPLGADAVVHDPDELARSAAGHLPGPGRRRWGVRLSRSEGTLLMAPTGRLDATSAARLADVAVTRLGSYSRLVLDLGEVAEIEPDGVRALAGWPDLLPAATVDLRLRADRGSRAMLDGTGVALSWPAVSSTPELSASGAG